MKGPYTRYQGFSQLQPSLHSIPYAVQTASVTVETLSLTMLPTASNIMQINLKKMHYVRVAS